MEENECALSGTNACTFVCFCPRVCLCVLYSCVDTFVFRQVGATQTRISFLCRKETARRDAREKRSPTNCQLGSTSQSWGARATVHLLHQCCLQVWSNNRVTQLSFKMSFFGCVHRLLATVVDVAAPYVTRLTPRLARSKRILWQINLLRAKLSGNVDQGSQWVFTGPLALVSSLLCIFPCSFNVTSTHVSKPGGKKKRRGRRGELPILSAVSCACPPYPSLSAREEFCSTKVHCKKKSV